MTQQQIETSASTLDYVLVTLAVISALAGVIGFALLADSALYIRLGTLVGGLALAVILAWVSPLGKRLLAYGHQSFEELRRVVWPTKKETLNTTGLVIAFVVIMSVFLLIVDKLVEFGLYDVLLRLSAH